ncbi:pre-peptidase C-terminal domain-containing protein [uncultured Microscilla sp.]|uniref:pre-peptidase C-terminal domain-containing protein n=1 Tax=uncultured Microscilla sp. TaxID=432653 RepID=UPI00262CD880|nr:pre-peptidase C-terminal domain-containing protein [uncultured Microscilla sp.]
MHYFQRLLYISIVLVCAMSLAQAQLIPAPQLAKDIPADAQEFAIGSCDINFAVSSDFSNSAVGTTAPCAGFALGTIQEDAWAKFTTPTTGGNFVIRYTNTTEDAVVLVYDDNAGTPNTLMGCQNNIPGTGTESLELNLTANTVYWVRILNIGANEGMNGKLCLFRQHRNDTQAAASTAPSLPIGSCNVQFDIDGNNSGFGDVGIGCTSIQPSVTNNRDGWVKIDATVGQNIAVEYQSDNGSNYPGIVIYYDNSGLQLDIDGVTAGDQTACYDGLPPTSSFAKVDFTAAQTGTYYIRILNMANANIMEGSLCVYENTVKAHATACSAEATKLVNGDCNVQFNVYGGAFNNNLGAPTVSCAAPPGIPSEAWASFDGTAGNTYTILYDNDNNDASEAIDVALVVYRANGTACGAPASLTEVVCRNKINEGTEVIEFNAPNTDTYYIRVVNVSDPTTSNTVFGSLCFYEGTTVRDDLCTSSSAVGVGTCGLAFNITDKYINNEGRNAPSACSGTTVSASTSSYRDGWMNFVALTDRTRIEYNETGSQDAVLAIYTGDCNALSLVSCVNAVTDGIEAIEINTNPNQVYFIRVINITNSGNMNGDLCITNVLVDDACSGSSIREILVGSCNQKVSIAATTDAGAGDASGMGVQGCGSPTPAKDVWFKFTGNGGDITIQYENQENTSNPLIEVYYNVSSVNCPVPSNIGAFTPFCANDCNTSAIQTETVTIPTTVNGRTYFARIVNLDETAMTGLVCIFNSSDVPQTGTPVDRSPSNACTAANTIQVGDCGMRFNIPVSTGICATPSVSHFDNSGTSLGTCAPAHPIGTPTADGWVKFTATAGQDYTVTYDNNNQLLTPSNDIALAVYDGSGVACGSFTATQFIACVNDVNGVGLEQLKFTAPSTGDVYIRVMNVSGNNTTTYGKLCLFSGDSRAVDACNLATTPTFTLGEVDIPFNISDDFTLQTTPSAGVANCVFTSGNNRARKDGWASFDSGATADTISVVYNNDDGDSVIELDPDVNNAALVVYEVPQTDPAPCTNMVRVGCANVVGEGSETLTFIAKPNHRYFVRVISTRFTSTMQGKLSIFVYSSCNLGDEQVRDGDFTNFPKNSIDLGTTFTYTAANLKAVQEKHVFATQYGYRQHTGHSGEMGGPSHYGVASSARRLFEPFFSYGYRYNGWGAAYDAYCNNGSPGHGTDACPKTTAPPESNNDANFFVTDGLSDRAKIWCQTIPMAAGTNRYYVFSGWFNSLIPSNRSNLDDPQIRITVCEGKGLYNPALTATANEAAGNLSGVTLTSAQATSAGMYTLSGTESTADVMHRPVHPGVTWDKGNPISAYGAARACNPGNLKVINSDVFLPESPDNWVAMQCIYQVPDDVTHVNLCLENISSTQNGNDFGIDLLSFRQCLNGAAIANTLNRISCELGNDPTVLGIPLTVQMLHFDGKLRKNKVFLNWLTSSETNLREYEVQRAVSGGKFRTIATVTAKGNPDTPALYDFIDNDLPVGEEFVYYRLNAINQDGTHGYSPMVEININTINKLNLKLSPNPTVAGKDIQLTFNAPKAGTATLNISNMMGVRLTTQSIQTRAAKNVLTLDTTGLKAGVYIVQVVMGEVREAKKIIVQH